MSDTRTITERFFATLEARDWDGFGALLDPDVVYEIPQSGERILGRDRYVQFNSEYPGEWHLSPKTIVADEGGAGVWFDWTLGDGEHNDAVVFLRCRRRPRYPGHRLLAGALRPAARARAPRRARQTLSH